jgi:hypothetical protein
MTTPVGKVFILKIEIISSLHVYTYTHTWTKIIHTHTQISYRRIEEKETNVVMMNNGDVER